MIRLLLLPILLLAPAACTPRALVKAVAAPRPDLEAKLDRVEHVIGACQVQGVYMMCDRRSLIDSLVAAAEMYRAAGLCYADLKECSDTADIDVSVERTKRQRAEADLDHARWMRWVWGAVGLVLGSAITAGAVFWR